MKLSPRTRLLSRTARDLFGWPALRPGQVAGMRAVLRGRDAVVVLPTGGGKSAIYQVPGVLLDGPTIVISPLLALQQDQLAGLNDRGDERLAAVRVSSAETPARQRTALEALRDGRARFLFITPEQLTNPERLAEVRALKPALVAVDEAHCVSSWGYDFRPDYLQLGHLIRDLGRPPVVALTATASPPVRADIIAALGLRDPLVVVNGLDRPNLHLAAQYCTSEDQRWQRLLAEVQAGGSPGVVYAPTRAIAEQFAARLCEAGVDAAAFHAGLAAGERNRRFADFMADRVPVMVATSAFGMGVDKPNIRWVHHVALPDSPDSYLQEIGRAGRDGAPARTLLLFRPEDIALQRFFAAGAPDPSELTELAAVLREGPTTKSELANRTGLPARKLTQLLGLLEQVGAVAVGRAGRLTVPRYAAPPSAAAADAVRQFERQQTLRRSRIDMMRQYAETGQCRGRTLLAYFGEQVEHACGHCDNCAAGGVGAVGVGGAVAVGGAARRDSGWAGWVPRLPPRRGTGRPWPAWLAWAAWLAGWHGLVGRSTGPGRSEGRRAAEPGVRDQDADSPGGVSRSGGVTSSRGAAGGALTSGGASGSGRAPRSGGALGLGSAGGPGGDSESGDASRPGGARPFPVNSAVRHTEWGPGTVMAYERDRMVVLFEEVGYKTLSVGIVRQRGLLVPDPG